MKPMWTPDLQAEYIDLESLEQIDICPELVVEFEESEEESEEDFQIPLPF